MSTWQSVNHINCYWIADLQILTGAAERSDIQIYMLSLFAPSSAINHCIDRVNRLFCCLLLANFGHSTCFLYHICDLSNLADSMTELLANSTQNLLDNKFVQMPSSKPQLAYSS